MMVQAGKRHQYYRDEVDISERNSRPFWSISELKANWTSWEDCNKIKVPKRLSYTVLEHSPTVVKVLIPVIKAIEKNNPLLDCLGSCFSFYLDHKPASNLYSDF